MQLPKESLKNIQAFYLLIPRFQNVKFIYSSLQGKSFSYISIIWLWNYLSPPYVFDTDLISSPAKYLPVFSFVGMHVSYCDMFRFCSVSAVENFVRCNYPVSHFLHPHGRLSIRPSLGIRAEEFLSLYAFSLSPLQKRLILKLALEHGLALFYIGEDRGISLPYLNVRTHPFKNSDISYLLSNKMFVMPNCLMCYFSNGQTQIEAAAPLNKSTTIFLSTVEMTSKCSKLKSGNHELQSFEHWQFWRSRKIAAARNFKKEENILHHRHVSPWSVLLWTIALYQSAREKIAQLL